MGVLTEVACLGREAAPARLSAAALLLGALALFPFDEARAARTVTAASVGHAGSTGALTSVQMTDDGTGADATAEDGVFSAQVPAYEDDLPRYVFTYTLVAAAEEPEAEDVGTTPTTLFINELMASNSATVLDPQGDADDWIELKNTGTAAIDLGGMYLSDSRSNRLKWRFPAGTSINAGGYLLVWADDDDGDTPGLHASFKLSGGGESVVLSDTDARDNVVIDSVDFPAQTTDVSYGRAPEGTGAFQALAVASPGRPTPTVPEIRIVADGPVTEGGTATFTVSAAPKPTAELVVGVSVTQGADDDYLPAAPPSSVTIGAGATETILSVAIPDDAVDEPNGVLTVTVAGGTGYTVSATSGSASATIRDDDAGPAASVVVINELMASNSETSLDPQGDADDWIELHNTSDATVDLSGMYLSDDRSNPKKWQFPPGTTIPANGYLVVWADDDTDDSPGLHANFKLSAKGESVVLSDTDANGNTVVDAVDFPALGRDVAYGRWPDGTGTFQVLPVSSPGVAAPLLPQISIAADGPATEGGSATFTLTATPAPAAEVVVSVTVTQGADDDYLPDALPDSVTIAADATETTLSVALPDDTDDEPHGLLTATLASGAGYLVSATAGSASMTVRDNDLNPAASAVVVNELMASNTETTLDPQGEADDWIELKNTSEAALDLSGMYLSDDRSRPQKWRIPAGTTITAGGYLLVWADDDDGDSPGLHASFKLSAKGESVVFSDTEDNGNAVVDAVDFPALGDDESYARMPDGSGPFRTLPASPGAANPLLPALSITAGAAATEGGTATFTITADPAPATDLAVALSVTQGADDDYLPDTLPTAVTIAAGATETTLSVALPDDTVDEPDGIIVATIGTSPDYEVTTSTASLAVHDNDNDVPSLSIAAGEAVTEGDTATFTITVDPAPAATLAVAVSVTQGANDDYLPDNLTTALWIPPGATTAVVVVAFPDDELDEPDGVVTVTIGESSDYDVTTSSASLTVHDNDLPTLSIAAGETATEGGTATFTITAEQALSADLAVPVAVTEEGSPVGGLRRASTVRLARGALQATLTVPLPDDEVVEPDGAVVATILEGPDNVGGLEYHIAVASARVVVLDDDVPALSITGGAAVTEGGTATFTVTADQAPVADLVVDVSVTQGAQDDYLPDTPPTSVTIAAGATDATLSVPLPDDQLDEPDGEVTATVAASPKYDVTVASARVTVHDDDVPLTAEFVDMPESHDGRTPFAFELRFSEDFPGQLPFTLLRDEAFRVEHGRVRRAGRVEEGQNQRWTIEVRPESHEAVTIELPAATDCSAAGAVCSEAGRPLSNTVSATVAGPPPLTAEFVDVPKSHDGQSLFEFELRFSEDFPGRLPFALLRDEAFRVEHGTVYDAARIEQRQNQRWTIQVQPDSHEAVTIELPATTDCSAARAVCSEAGRPLSNTVSATVAGPPPLTAEFVEVPESHDGESAFEFELRFSEDFPGRLAPALLREEAFEVENGTVQRARRVAPEQNQRWTIQVQPDSHADVTIELPAASDCSAAGAVCTEAGRPLSNAPSATVAGPRPAARVDGPVLTLAWPTPRDGFAAPGGKDFAVRVDGGVRPVTSASLWPRGVVLELAEPVQPEQAVALDYLGSAMHPLRDAAGNAEGAWRDLPVVNMTEQGGDAPAILAADAILPPPADSLSASFAGQELGDAGLAVATLDPGVRRLDLSGNALTDIAALAPLATLQSLDLSDNAIVDLAPLRGLTALRRLDLGGNDIGALWPLAELPKLEVLLLDGNRVTALGALTHMTGLEHLDLAGNAVADLSPLADLSSLRRLDLGRNPARDLSPVGDLDRLVWLRLPDAGGDVPSYRLVRLRWLLAPDAPGQCLGCAVLRNPYTSAR